MAVRNHKKVDKTVKEVRKLLEEKYLPDYPKAKIDVYRYNSASIRIRVIDPSFSGLDWIECDTFLWKTIEELSEDTISQITLLMCLTPNEIAKSMMNMEFEDPTPTRFLTMSGRIRTINNCTFRVNISSSSRVLGSISA
jgi:hypothetical protein